MLQLTGNYIMSGYLSRMGGSGDPGLFGYHKPGSYGTINL